MRAYARRSPRVGAETRSFNAACPFDGVVYYTPPAPVISRNDNQSPGGIDLAPDSQ